MNTEKEVRIKQKVDTAENWENSNSILLENEIGYEVNTGCYKVGNNNQEYSELDYFSVGSFNKRERNGTIIRGESLNRINENQSLGRYSLAVNNKTKAYGDAAFASGYNTQAGVIDEETGLPPNSGYTDTPTAMGSGTKALGNYSMAVNYRNTAMGARSFAANNMNTVEGDDACGFGVNNIASGQGSFSTGSFTEASGIRSTTFGENVIASGENSIAGGDATQAIGENSCALGYNTMVEGLNSLSVGNANNILSNNSFAIGANNTIKIEGKNSIVSGNGNTCESSNSYLLGTNNSTSNVQQILVNGEGNKVLASNTFVSGRNNTINAAANDSLCCGYYCSVSAAQSEATGMRCNANGFHSIAKGLENDANGTNSIALGYQIITNGDNSLGLGQTSTINGYGSISLGYGNTLSGTRHLNIGNYNSNTASQTAITVGNYLIASTNNQIILGRYNKETTDLIAIGGGSNTTDRKNILSLNANGDLSITGKITADNLITTNIQTTIFIDDICTIFSENEVYELTDYAAKDYNIILSLNYDYCSSAEEIQDLNTRFKKAKIIGFSSENKFTYIGELDGVIPVLLTIVAKKVNSWQL